MLSADVLLLLLSSHFRVQVFLQQSLSLAEPLPDGLGLVKLAVGVRPDRQNFADLFTGFHDLTVPRGQQWGVETV